MSHSSYESRYMVASRGKTGNRNVDAKQKKLEKRWHSMSRECSENLYGDARHMSLEKRGAYAKHTMQNTKNLKTKAYI